jgi:hypothetical protein
MSPLDVTCFDHQTNVISRSAASNTRGPLLRQAGRVANSLPTVRILSTLRTSGFNRVPCWSAESACSKVQVLKSDGHGISAFIPVRRQSVNSSRPEVCFTHDAPRQGIRQISRPTISIRGRFTTDRNHHLMSAELERCLLKSRVHSPLRQTSRPHPHPSRTKKWGHVKDHGRAI